MASACNRNRSAKLHPVLFILLAALLAALLPGFVPIAGAEEYPAEAASICTPTPTPTLCPTPTPTLCPTPTPTLCPTPTPTPCPTPTPRQQETAWGDGCRINFSQNWSTYFDYNGVSKTTPLIYGRKAVQIGVVSVIRLDDGIRIAASVFEDWKMTSFHVYVGLDRPDTSAPGQFPYKLENADGATSWYIDIPASQLPGDGSGPPLVIAAHADVYR